MAAIDDGIKQVSQRILVLQHHPAGTPGLVGAAITERGWGTTLLDATSGTTLPADALDHAGLVILGGDMNAYADEICPHFPALLDLARRFALVEKPVLGICLGGQLLARAFGAEVCLGAAPEFGVTPLQALPAAATDPLLAGAPAPHLAMQWHDDTFELPAGAVPLLASEGCTNQAFRIGASIWGFQCHFETDVGMIRAWGRERARAEGNPARIEQADRDAASVGAAAEAFGRHVAARWLDRCSARVGD